QKIKSTPGLRFPVLRNTHKKAPAGFPAGALCF
ncbi:MAG: hypothetical protein ACI8RU_002421, partial [Zhongshania aliphaticivorans]